MTPQIEILTCDISARDAGVMLVALNRVGATRGVILALDRFGRVVWCKEVPFGIVDFRQSLRGTLLIVADDGHALEMGLNGHVLRQWFGADRFPEGAFGVQLAVETLHGSIEEIAPDIYLSMSVRRHSDGTSDTVLVFDRKGAVHWEWDLRELVGLDHCTCALMDPTDGGILLALRDLDGVVKISRRGALEWVLGDDMPAALARKALAVEGGMRLA